MATPTRVREATDFVAYMEEWHSTLAEFSLKDDLRDPARAAILSADMVVGFCGEGALASPRVAGIVEPVVSLFQRAHDVGVRYFVLAQDTHSEKAEEFNAFPPHCLRGTSESDTIPELKRLPFSDTFTVVEKNSLDPSLGTGLESWLDSHSELEDLIVVGDCTDLCTYSSAMYLRLRANARGLKQRVVVPANAVQTYDMPIETAREIGALAHPGDFFHLTFLYHMALNGIRVVKSVV